MRDALVLLGDRLGGPRRPPATTAELPRCPRARPRRAPRRRAGSAGPAGRSRRASAAASASAPAARSLVARASGSRPPALRPGESSPVAGPRRPRASGPSPRRAGTLGRRARAGALVERGDPVHLGGSTPRRASDAFTASASSRTSRMSIIAGAERCSVLGPLCRRSR